MFDTSLVIFDLKRVLGVLKFKCKFECSVKIYKNEKK